MFYPRGPEKEKNGEKFLSKETNYTLGICGNECTTAVCRMLDVSIPQTGRNRITHVVIKSSEGFNLGRVTSWLRGTSNFKI